MAYETVNGGGGGRAGIDQSAVNDAIQNAQRKLALLWKETGSWRDCCDAGPAVTAVVAVVLQFIGRLEKETALGIAAYLRRTAMADGSYPSYPRGDTGDLAATAECYAGLIATGKVDEQIRENNAPYVERAEDFISHNGGEAKLLELARAGDLAALTLAMVGALQAELPTTPMLFGLAPGVEYLLAQRFGYLVPFRALVSDVVAAHLRTKKAASSRPGPLRLPRIAGLPQNAHQLSDQLTRGLNSATEHLTNAATSIARSGVDQTANFVKGTTRTLLGIAQGGMTAAAGVADSLRLGPFRLLESAVRGALQAGNAVTSGAMAAVSTFHQLGPGALAPGALGAGSAAVQQVEGLRCDVYLHKYRNEDGSWLYGDSVHTALALAAYHALGVPSNDQTINETVEWLTTEPTIVREDDGTTRFNVFYTDIWPTAFALRALLESGTPASDPAISRAINWLIAVQRSGSWAFQATNTTTPDMDDTAMAMATLAIARDKLKQESVKIDPTLNAMEQQLLLARCDAAIDGARVFILARQNADGGWASYQPGLPGKKRGAIMTKVPEAPPSDNFLKQVEVTLNPDPALGDPATEDVTARVLFALGKSGLTAKDPAVARAIQFLINQQDTNHGWWGRWVVNYVASTAWVLRGLAAVGADLDAQFVEDAVAFLLSRRGDDGGWTESVKSYADPTLGRKPNERSNPCLTGLVLSALIESGHGDKVQSGIKFLIDSHKKDAGGRASEANARKAEIDSLHTLYPPSLFYTLPQTVLQLPLEALALYQLWEFAQGTNSSSPSSSYSSRSKHSRALQAARATFDPFKRLRSRLNQQQVDALKGSGDKPADDIIDAILKKTMDASPAARMDTFFRSLISIADFTDQSNIDSILGPGARELVDQLDPPESELDLDSAKIRDAQDLFRRAGFGVPLVLFCSSLPQCYAVPDGAKVLLDAGRIATNPRSRMIETAQFVFDVLALDGLTKPADGDAERAIAAGRIPPGRGLRTARKIRLMHAAIRKLLSLNGGDGQKPISQFEMLGTLMTFSVVVTDGLRALGFPVSDAEANSWFHLWRQVGKLLGVVEPEGLTLETAADGADFFDRVREDWAYSPQGSTLARVSLDLIKELLPSPEFDGIGPTLVRHLAGERCADLLGVDPSDWTEILIDPSPLLDTIEGRVIGCLCETALTPLLQQAAFGTMVALSEQQREGKGVTFSIPPDFLNGWRNTFQTKFRV
jgi:squalene cyclase